jgi:hypothetical protein
MRLFRVSCVVLLFLLIFSIKKIEKLDGHYVSVDKTKNEPYATLDISDSVILVNRNSISIHDRDTVIINTKNNSFIRSTQPFFPFCDFKVTKNGISLFYQHDAGIESVDFIRDTFVNELETYYTTSKLKIDLKNCASLYFRIDNHVALKNIPIGVPKNESFGNSIKIQVEDAFISTEELKQNSSFFADSSLWICLHFDKNVPDSLYTRIKKEFKKYVHNRVIEARAKNDKIVYMD